MGRPEKKRPIRTMTHKWVHNIYLNNCKFWGGEDRFGCHDLVASNTGVEKSYYNLIINFHNLFKFQLLHSCSKQ